ncbi:MAG: response regulator [Arcobacteraceae bacterium]|nr:response regulator [Arcobacteraceae bacterium]
MKNKIKEFLMRYKILIVEDDRIIAKDIEKTLSKKGFNVIQITSSHIETINFLENNKVDLILMDINIKGAIDGIQSCDEINQKYNIPIIFITAYNDIETISLIKDSYAVGYLQKPFKYADLLLNIFLILKHNSHQPKIIQKHIIFLQNGFHYCLEKRLLYKNNVEVNLSQIEKDILFILCKNKNNFISYEQLFENVWKNQKFCINKIRGSIFRLKHKVVDLNIINNKEYGYKIE